MVTTSLIVIDSDDSGADFKGAVNVNSNGNGLATKGTKDTKDVNGYDRLSREQRELRELNGGDRGKGEVLSEVEGRRHSPADARARHGNQRGTVS